MNLWGIEMLMQLRRAASGLSFMAWCLMLSTAANVTTAMIAVWFLLAGPVIRTKGDTEINGPVEVQGSVAVEGTVVVENPRRGPALDVRIVDR